MQEEDFIFDWNDEKNNILQEERNVCFEDVVLAFNENRILDILKNPSKNFQDQFSLVVKISNYVYLVPFVKNWTTFFLKTIYPSRKYNKIFN